MKKTKSMVYNPTVESKELHLYCDNKEVLYNQVTKCKINNLKKKMQKGIYDSEKAIASFYQIATIGSDLYNKDFGYKFSVQDRYTVAVDMEREFREDYED